MGLQVKVNDISVGLVDVDANGELTPAEAQKVKEAIDKTSALKGKTINSIVIIDSQKVDDLASSRFKVSDLTPIKALYPTASKDPATSVAAKLFGTVSVKIGGKTYTAKYNNLKPGEISPEEKAAGKAALEKQIQKGRKLAGVDLTYSEPEIAADKSPTTAKIEKKEEVVKETLTGSYTKAAPKPNKSEGDDDEVEEPGAAKAAGDSTPDASGLVRFDVPIKIPSTAAKAKAGVEESKTVKIAFDPEGARWPSKAYAKKFMEAYRTIAAAEPNGRIDNQGTVQIGDKSVPVTDIMAWENRTQDDPIDPATPAAEQPFSPLSDVGGTTKERTEYLRNLRAQVSNLLDMLLSMIASGNFGAIGEAFNLISLAASINTSEQAVVLGQALSKMTDDITKMNDKLASLYKDPTKNQAAIYEMRTKLNQLEQVKETLASIMKEAATSQQAAIDLKKALTDKLDQIQISGAR
jgi:hypothetical protein